MDGATQEESLLPPEAGNGASVVPSDWSSDDRHLIYTRTQGVGGSSDIWALPLAADRTPFAIAQTAASEINGVLSPNGRWIAHQAIETAQPQIYVQPFPPTGGKFQVSTGGGYGPMWRADAKELFFASLDGKMMTAAVETGNQFHAAAPVALFAVASFAPLGAGGRQYAVTRDGRFLINVQHQAANAPLTVVVNWPAAVQR